MLFMKFINRFKYILIILLFSVFGLACNKKTGCPANEAASVKVKRNGELPSKRGDSQLFNRKMRKKMKKR